MGAKFIKICDEDRKIISFRVCNYLEFKVLDEDENPVDKQVVEMGPYKTKPPPKRPKQCPRGHKHFSWSADENHLFCWDCNRKYPFTECFGPREDGSSIDTKPDD